MEAAGAGAAPAEGKQDVPGDAAFLEAASDLSSAASTLQDELATQEAMQEGTDEETSLKVHQERLDEVLNTVEQLQSRDVVAWLEGEDLWAVPRQPLPLFGPGRLTARMPLLFSSATLEPDYMARVLRLPAYDHLQVGVPFNLARQVLVYEAANPAANADPDREEVEQVLAIIRAVQGRTLVLLNSMAEVRRYREVLAASAPPWRVLFDGDADRGKMLETFRQDTASVLIGTTFWEGVDVAGEALSCVIIPHLPFPAHDPLIRERRRQASDQGQDPFLAVDVPETLLKLKQGMGRLIRTAEDRGVLALLERPEPDRPWAEAVAAVFPEGAERTSDLGRLAAFCPPARVAAGTQSNVAGATPYRSPNAADRPASQPVE